MKDFTFLCRISKKIITFGGMLMSDIQITQITFAIQAQIGDLNDKKKGILADKITRSTRYKDALNSPFGFIFIAPQDNENLLINFDRVAYTKAGKEFDINQVTEALSIICETLLLEDEFFVTIDIQGISQTDNSQIETLKLFEANNCKGFSESHPEVYGVGYRFLIKADDCNGELKIEPLIRDARNYFYQYIVNYNTKKLPLTEITKAVNGTINQLLKNFEDLRKLVEVRG